MNKVYSGYEIELNKEEDKAYKAKILKIEGNSYQETRDEVAGTTVSGDFISISDAQDLPITKFNIEGKSVQETREGYNLVDFSNPTNKSAPYSFENDILVVSSSYQYANINWNLLDLFKTNAGKTVYFKSKEVDSSNAISPTAQLTITNNGTNSYINLFNTLYTIPTDTSNLTKAEFGIYCNNSSTDTASSITITEPMLVFEENADKPYEQYGASPSIEYEAPIKSVGDNIQLFDKDNANILKGYISSSTKQIVLSDNVTDRIVYISCEPNKTYTAKKMSTSRFNLFTCSEVPKTNLSASTYVNTGDNATINTVTSSSNDKYLGIQICSTTAEINNIQEILDSIKICEGTSTGAYSPYGQGSIEIKQVNKNFLDLTKKPYSESSSALNGAKVTLNGGVLNVDATNSTEAVTIRSIWADCKSSSTILLPKGTYYTALILNITGVESLNSKQVGGETFTLEEDCYLTQWFFNVAQGNKSTKVLQIERGEKQTDYIEHQSQTKALYTQQPFRAIEDVKDRFVKQNGVWYEEHNVEEKIYTGNENWEKRNSLGDSYTRFGTTSSYGLNAIGFCDKLKVLSNVNWANQEEKVDIDNSSISITVKKDRLDTDDVAGFKNFLLSNNITIYAKLKEPLLIPCTPEQVEVLESMRTYEGVNHIYTTDELKPTISLRYNYMPALPSLDGESKAESVGDNINLFDKDKATANHYVLNTTGVLVASQVTSTSDYIEVKANKPYTISYNYNTLQNTGGRAIALYNKEKTFLSGKQFTISDKKVTITPTEDGYIRFSYDNNCFDIKAEQNSKATPYSPYGQGSIEIKQQNANLADFNVSQNSKVTVNNDGTVTINGNGGFALNFKQITFNANKTYYMNWIIESGKATQSKNDIIMIPGGGKWAKQGEYTRFSFSEDTIKSSLWVNAEATFENAKMKIWISEEQIDYTPHQSQTKALYTQQPFRAIGDVKDRFVKQNGVWYEKHNIARKILNGSETTWNLTVSDEAYCFYFRNNTITNCLLAKHKKHCNYFKYEETSYTTATNPSLCENSAGYNEHNFMFIFKTNGTWGKTVDEWKAKLVELYNAGTPVYVDYVLATPTLIPCTPQQSTILDQLENIQLYDGVNYIYTIDEIQPLLTLEIYNMIEDYDLYVSNDGYFGIPGTDIKFLVNFHESNLPTMPEAVEASVRAAGRDGDYVLNTTYEPLPFEIVCYTEDNLTPTQKKEIESKVNRFLNSIKNRTKRIAFEKGEKFYNVKYNGLLTTTNYPAHLKFSIPLKSSESFGKDAYQKVLSGNSTEVSDTVEEVGALITIYGPATLPIIALNDYSMEYDTAILEGARVEIDTAKSTATHINSDGVKTNVMRHYNHQFPKIQPGENTLKVLSGVDDENNVTVKWNDLKL